jgi:hypothetical protein
VKVSELDWRSSRVILSMAWNFPTSPPTAKYIEKMSFFADLEFADCHFSRNKGGQSREVAFRDILAHMAAREAALNCDPAL